MTNMRDISIYGHRFELRFPNECPVCHYKMDLRNPVHSHCTESQSPRKVQLVFKCENIDCDTLFIAHYDSIIQGKRERFYLARMTPSSPEPREIPEAARAVSERAINILSQADSALSEGLDEIAGPGYRKALEILIKDYVIGYKLQNPIDEDRDVVRQMRLAGVINTYFEENSDIRDMAERAVWLGNDETHYVRKWEDRDIYDVRILIDLILNEIHHDALVSKYRSEMPDRRK